MGRHVGRFVPVSFASVSLAVVLFSSACGLTPADEELAGSDDGPACPDVDRPSPVALTPGTIVEYPSAGAEHVLCEVAYATSPPTSGSHFPAWQNCGFYTSPVRDETAVHALEHGAIWIAYAPDLASEQRAAIEVLVATDPHWLASPYPGLRNPIVLSAWTRQLAVDDIGDPMVAIFAAAQLGRVSQTAPEAGAICAEQIGVAPTDPDAGYTELLRRLEG